MSKKSPDTAFSQPGSGSSRSSVELEVRLLQQDMTSFSSQRKVDRQERIAKLLTHFEGGFHYLTEETGIAVGLPKPHWSYVGEVNKAGAPAR